MKKRGGLLSLEMKKEFHLSLKKLIIAIINTLTAEGSLLTNSIVPEINLVKRKIIKL